MPRTKNIYSRRHVDFHVHFWPCYWWGSQRHWCKGILCCYWTPFYTHSWHYFVIGKYSKYSKYSKYWWILCIFARVQNVYCCSWLSKVIYINGINLFLHIVLCFVCFFKSIVWTELLLASFSMFDLYFIFKFNCCWEFFTILS